MMNRLFRSLLLTAFLATPAVALAQDAFPPLADRYQNPSEDMKAVIKALKKLQARTEIGINLVDYDKAVSEVFPEVKVFIESQDAKALPEIRLLLANAMECHLKTREIWSQSVASNNATKKYEASVFLITARPMLWKIASANVSGAVALVEGSQEDRVQTQEMIAANKNKLTVTNGLALAEAELVSLDRQSRSKESGIEAPPPDASGKVHDLAAILYADGDFGDSLTVGPIKERLPPVFSKVPPALQEGRLPLLKDGETQGGIAGFIYGDTKIAQRAFDSIASGFGSDKQRVKGLGSLAVRSAGVAGGSVSLVFRRGPVVVSLVSPLASALPAAQNIDRRIAELFPDEEPAMNDDEPAKPSSVDTLADLLYQEGDLDNSLVGSPFTPRVALIFSEISGANEQGEVAITKLGDRVGGINGFIFSGEKDAKSAFERIAAGIGSTGLRIPGVGNAAYGSRVPISGSQDMVFRRNSTVVHIRTPSKNTADITKIAKKIDARIRKAAQPKTGVDKAARPKAEVE